MQANRSVIRFVNTTMQGPANEKIVFVSSQGQPSKLGFTLQKLTSFGPKRSTWGALRELFMQKTVLSYTSCIYTGMGDWRLRDFNDYEDPKTRMTADDMKHVRYMYVILATATSLKLDVYAINQANGLAYFVADQDTDLSHLSNIDEYAETIVDAPADSSILHAKRNYARNVVTLERVTEPIKPISDILGFQGRGSLFAMTGLDFGEIVKKSDIESILKGFNESAGDDSDDDDRYRTSYFEFVDGHDIDGDPFSISIRIENYVPHNVVLGVTDWSDNATEVIMPIERAKQIIAHLQAAVEIASANVRTFSFVEGDTGDALHIKIGDDDVTVTIKQLGEQRESTILLFNGELFMKELREWVKTYDSIKEND